MIRDLLRVEPGPRPAELQQRLFAAAEHGSPRRVLVVLQGMDTSGKGGAVEKVLGLVNPAGVRVTGVGKPTEEERAHDFLRRIDRGGAVARAAGRPQEVPRRGAGPPAARDARADRPAVAAPELDLDGMRAALRG